MDAVDDDEIAGESAEHIPTPENFENHKSKHSYKQKAGNNNQENESVKPSESQTTTKPKITLPSERISIKSKRNRIIIEGIRVAEVKEEKSV